MLGEDHDGVLYVSYVLYRGLQTEAMDPTANCSVRWPRFCIAFVLCIAVTFNS